MYLCVAEDVGILDSYVLLDSYTVRTLLEKHQLLPRGACPIFVVEQHSGVWR